LRKGPQDVPDSALILLVSMCLLIIATLASVLLARDPGSMFLLVQFAINLLGYFLYWLLLVFFGFPQRARQTIASIMACGSLLTICAIVAFVLVDPILDASFASLMIVPIIFWAIPVKGHIIAQAIERHWYIGIVIAMTIFVTQYAVTIEISKRLAG